MTAEVKRRMKMGKAIAQQLIPLATQRETARVFGLTPQRIEQIESLALAKLALRLREQTGFEIKL